MCGCLSVLCWYFSLSSVQFILLVLCAVFMLVDCAVCSTLLAPLVAGASRPLRALWCTLFLLVNALERFIMAHGHVENSATLPS